MHTESKQVYSCCIHKGDTKCSVYKQCGCCGDFFFYFQNNLFKHCLSLCERFLAVFLIYGSILYVIGFMVCLYKTVGFCDFFHLHFISSTCKGPLHGRPDIAFIHDLSCKERHWCNYYCYQWLCSIEVSASTQWQGRDTSKAKWSAALIHYTGATSKDKSKHPLCVQAAE